jgi:hypothetical protein
LDGGKRRRRKKEIDKEKEKKGKSDAAEVAEAATPFGAAIPPTYIGEHDGIAGVGAMVGDV